MSEMIDFIQKHYPMLMPVCLILFLISFLIKWGFTPRSAIEFLDYLSSRKLKKINEAVALDGINSDLKFSLLIERDSLLGYQFTGIGDSDHQRVILKILNSSKYIRQDYFARFSFFMVKKGDILIVERNCKYWISLIYYLTQSILLSFMAFLSIVLAFSPILFIRIAGLIFFTASIGGVVYMLTTAVWPWQIDKMKELLIKNQEQIINKNNYDVADDDRD